VTDSTQPASADPREARARRPLRTLIAALYAVALVALASAALKGWRDHQRAVERENVLQADIAATEARIAALKLRNDRLQHDPATIDREARDELGLVRPDEVVIVLPETESSPAKP